MANSHLSHIPSQAMRSGTEIYYSLKKEAVLQKVIDVVCNASPLCKRLLTTWGPFVVFLFTVYELVGKRISFRKLLTQLHNRLLGKVTIPTDHPLHEQVLFFIMSQQDAKADERSLTLRRRRPAQYAKQNEENDSDLYYVPALGSSSFKWNGHTLMFERSDSTQVQVGNRTVTKPGSLTISCFSAFGGTKVIKEFLQHAHAQSKLGKEAKIAIYRVCTNLLRWPDDTWETKPVLRPARNLDSVAMKEAQKTDLISDITTYLDPDHKQWYKDRGMPYRRGYLFYGPAGTGKTSAVTATAGHFKLPLYFIALSNPQLHDSKLEELFDELPDRCLVVLEDVDSAGIQRETMNAPVPAPKSAPNTAQPQQKKITLSGLLNVIDGPCSHEGRVLIMTTNSPDALDPALIRPGRVDMKILFGNASREVIEKLFSHIYGPDCPHDLAGSFASKIPEDLLTPAEIQNFLLEHRENLAEAVDKAEKWARNLIATKASGKNVAAFTGQILAGATATATNATIAKAAPSKASAARPVTNSSAVTPAATIAGIMAGKGGVCCVNTAQKCEKIVAKDAPGGTANV